MSYLDPLRMHFAGKFQAAVSTVNNDPTHYDNRSFKPEFQVMPGGWWNPSGDADFRLIGCSATAAFDAAGEPLPDDPVLACLVADSDRQPPAKLVDLDPDQQMVSQIWGLEVRICDADGLNAVRGRFEMAPFTDIWRRATAAGGAGDMAMSSMYQSVLYDLEWGDVARSPFLTALQEASGDGLLSIKFNVDGYNMKFDDPDFTLGRVVGTIGPAAASEPRHFLAGRQLMTRLRPNITPVGGVNFCQAMLSKDTGKVYLDLGNALPTTAPGGPPANIGALSLTGGMHPPVDLGPIDYLGAGFYDRYAGVVALPAGRRLTDDEVESIRTGPLAIGRAGLPAPAAAEDPKGLHVRADQFVFRLDPGETAKATLYATQFGAPLANAEIAVTDDPGGLQGGAATADAIQFDTQVTADAQGVATLEITAADPGRPRDYIDGQVYAVFPSLPEATTFNPADFISLLVFSGFPLHGAPTWQLLQPIFQQYANLYPVMSRFLNLADEQSVRASRDLLLLSFKLGIDDPNTMPVTRDLSAAKRAAIVEWLESLPAGEPPPVPGEAPSPLPTPAPAEPVARTASAEEASFETLNLRGGKEAALARRNRPMSEPPPGLEP